MAITLVNLNDTWYIIFMFPRFGVKSLCVCVSFTKHDKINSSNSPHILLICITIKYKNTISLRNVDSKRIHFLLNDSCHIFDGSLFSYSTHYLMSLMQNYEVKDLWLFWMNFNLLLK
jgi:hypothetical protein